MQMNLVHVWLHIRRRILLQVREGRTAGPKQTRVIFSRQAPTLAQRFQSNPAAAALQGQRFYSDLLRQSLNKEMKECMEHITHVQSSATHAAPSPRPKARP